jgi:hypothetical protein
MYLAIYTYAGCAYAGKRDGGLKQFRDALKVLRCVYTQGLVFGFGHPDREAVLQCPELLQAFGLFERAHGQVGVTKKELATINI